MMRYRSPRTAPGGNAPRSSEPEETRRPTDEGGFGGTGFGGEPISVGRCESDEESAKPQPGQNRPASGTSASQRVQRVTFVRKWYLNPGSRDARDATWRRAGQ